MTQDRIKRLRERVFGPRVPRDLLFKNPLRFLIPTGFLGVAAVLLLVSTFLPYWKMELDAPQYPDGLELIVYVDRVEGDVAEVDGLNHYIGMRPLSEAGEFERSISVISISVLVALVVAGIFVHNPGVLLLSWPAILYPAIFLGDLWYWMRKFGNDLDPLAPLSSIIEPFTPPIWGRAEVAQFDTNAVWESGLWLAIAASALVVIGLILHRRAYKPLLDELRAARTEEVTAREAATVAGPPIVVAGG